MYKCVDNDNSDNTRDDQNCPELDWAAPLSVLHHGGLLLDEELHSLLLEGLAAVVIRIHAAAELEPLGQEVVELPGLLGPVKVGKLEISRNKIPSCRM